ncbi:MAG: cytochrome C [Desulfuromonas sp.]|nr:MAG: cytochrome C [Desulfuromonas sp.]
MCNLLILALLLFSLPTLALAEDETVCLQCHGGLDGYLAAPVAAWQGSVHAANGISCHGCHGGDPADFDMAMDPSRGFIGVPEPNGVPDFCGRCHVGVREDYLASAHGAALGTGGPQCVTCHGNHAVKEASGALINEQDCSRCHSFERAAQIRDAISATDSRIAELEGELPRLRRIGLTIRPMQDALFALRNDFHRLFHSVDVEKVRSETAAFGTRLDKVEGQIAEIDATLAKRKMGGAVAIVLLLLAGGVLLLIRKSYKEEE